jgi:hypothetical protein
MKILLILILAYAVVDVFASNINMDVYADLKQATPYQHCVYAYSGTPNLEQCALLRLDGE